MCVHLSQEATIDSIAMNWICSTYKDSFCNLKVRKATAYFSLLHSQRGLPIEPTLNEERGYGSISFLPPVKAQNHVSLQVQALCICLPTQPTAKNKKNLKEGDVCSLPALIFETKDISHTESWIRCGNIWTVCNILVSRE